MKKSLISLLLSLVLLVSLCGNAMASAVTFDYTVEEYATQFEYLTVNSLGAEVAWSDPVNTDDGLTGWTASAEGLSDVIVYSVTDQDACVGIGSQIVCDLKDTASMTAECEAFGSSLAMIAFTSCLVENDGDIDALLAEMDTIEAECKALVEAAFAPEALTAVMAEPYTYTYTAPVAGHNGQVVVSLDVINMSVTVTFLFMP